MPYVPDDAQFTPETLAYLRTPAGADLRAAIAHLPSAANPTVAEIAMLRKAFPHAATHAALVLARLQTKAIGPQGKFPHFSCFWATPEALEQATHFDVGRYKADRLAQLGASHVYDMCAGIGGDTLALAARFPVTAIELSPVRAKCLQFNLLESPPAHGVSVQVADVTAVLPQLPAGAWVHIDPARRSAGRRSNRFEDLIPGPELLGQLVSRPGIHAALKLSPAVDFDSLPAGHLELISHHGTVVQALLWVGTTLAPAQRTATVLSRAAPFHLTAEPQPVSVSPAPAGWFTTPATLYEVDGAVTRAGLAQHMAAAAWLVPLTTDGGYLLAPPGHARTLQPEMGAALTSFRIHSIVPFAAVMEGLRALPQSAPGAVEVKCRGHLPGIETDELQHHWTRARDSRGACTALLFRQEHRTLAALGFRV